MEEKRKLAVYAQECLVDWKRSAKLWFSQNFDNDRKSTRSERTASNATHISIPQKWQRLQCKAEMLVCNFYEPNTDTDAVTRQSCARCASTLWYATQR